MMLLPNLIITGKREREEPLKLFFLFSPWTELTRQSKWLMQRRWWWSNTQNVSSFLSSSLSVYYFSLPFVCLFSVSPGPLMTDFSRLSASQTLDMDSVGSGTVPGISGGVGGGKSCKKKKKRRHRYLHIPYSFFSILSRSREVHTLPLHANDCLSMSLFFGIFLSYLFNWLKLKNKFIQVFFTIFLTFMTSTANLLIRDAYTGLSLHRINWKNWRRPSRMPITLMFTPEKCCPWKRISLKIEFRWGNCIN